MTKKNKNKNSPDSPALATAQIVPKVCQGQFHIVYSKCSRSYPNRLTFRMNTVETRLSVFNIRLKPSFQPNNALNVILTDFCWLRPIGLVTVNYSMIFSRWHDGKWIEICSLFPKCFRTNNTTEKDEASDVCLCLLSLRC